MDLVTFTQVILNGKLHFLYCVNGNFDVNFEVNFDFEINYVKLYSR